jgi:hypothetical protein
LNRMIPRLLLASVVLCSGCGQVPRLASGQGGTALPRQYDESHAGESAVGLAGTQEPEDIEERAGPFAFVGQSFTVVLHYKRFPGRSSLDSRTLVSLEIRDAAGVVQHQQTFPYTIEEGAFSETCSADVELLKGSNGTGLLIESGCLPSGPLTGGPWQVFGVVGGKLAPFGKPLVAEGELGDFVPGAINRRGNLTQVLPDVPTIRVWTGYFFVPVPVRLDWREGRLALGQHCMFQTGHGLAEEGCEMPVDGVQLAPREQEMTFVRMFRESNERSGPPAHVVIKIDSEVDIIAGKVLTIWEDGPEAIYLSVDSDVWVKVRIDGQEGWIHTPEDLNAIGLFASG